MTVDLETLQLQEVVSHGADAGRGNLVGIQPFMRRADYANGATFSARLAGYFQEAARLGWLNPRSIVVLPEYLGTWLVAAGEPEGVYTASTVTGAMLILARRHLGRFARHLLRSGEKDRVKAALFRVKAGEMARIYHQTFSALAREYSCTLVAGSILLPEPRVVDGEVTAGSGPLYNAAFVFAPDGRAYPRAARKAFPIADELPFITPAPPEELPVFDTPAGRLGVLVCADSWFPQAYQALREQGVELLAVPSASSGGVWRLPWRGYSGWPAPSGVDPADIGILSEQQAWGKYALAGRTANSGARAGINVFLHGDLWDLDFSAGCWRLVTGGGEHSIEAEYEGAALINAWL